MLKRAFVVLALLTPALAQTPGTPAAILAKARSLYYTPVDRGLQSFHCEVQFDWKNFMQKAANQQIPETDERLTYLRSIKLSIDDQLRGAGELHWQAPAPPPTGSEDSVTKIQDGLQGVWAGFFQTWNGFMTGDMLEIDPKSTVETSAEGYLVSARQGAGLAEERFDRALQLRSVHITTATLESTIAPAFIASPQGLLVTALHSTYRQPPAAVATDVNMGLTYSPVNGFQLPSSLHVDVGPAQFSFQLANCITQSRVTHP